MKRLGNAHVIYKFSVLILAGYLPVIKQRKSFSGQFRMGYELYVLLKAVSTTAAFKKSSMVVIDSLFLNMTLTGWQNPRPSWSESSLPHDTRGHPSSLLQQTQMFTCPIKSSLIVNLVCKSAQRY